MSFPPGMTSTVPPSLTAPRRSREALPPQGTHWASFAQPLQGHATHQPWDALLPAIPAAAPQPLYAAPPLTAPSSAVPLPPAAAAPAAQPPPPPQPSIDPEPAAQPAKKRNPPGPKRRKPDPAADDPTPAPQPARSSNSNAARNARNAAARAEREGRKAATAAAMSMSMVSTADGDGEGIVDDRGERDAGVRREPVGVIEGMRYHVDFTTLPTATIFDYLERNKALPPFGTHFIKNPFDPSARACDPHKLYSFPTIEEPVAPHPLMQHLPGQTNAAATSSSSVAGGASASASVPYGIGIGIGPGLPVIREGKRRRGKEDVGEKDGEGQEKETEQEGEGAQDVRGEKDEAGAQVVGETEATADTKMDVDDAKAKQDDNTAAAAAAANEVDNEEDDEDDNDSSAPALRRSNRRPLPAGTSLAHTHRQTRSSPSPTPSTSSSTSSSSPRYRPILSDLALAHTIFAEHAARDWCAALAAGGGQTVQGPGVNPASAGQVMMGGTGGMQREGEVVADFLYTIKVKDRALKIAHEPAHAMFQNMF
ncbi:hypothetical protein NliqN6_6165 [Naganishia liquefaciens]|uniref:Uncharacterized protein n=1 Tax=Naganishia liquefaciens TaxID=104408 RepID=A0A8H3TZP9_9TREE|nr:hypothetical protein NliqN6_6165 [Naganishia liquefaciens]